LAGSSNLHTGYTYDPVAERHMPSYPLYHTSYEAFSTMKKFVDPDFTVKFRLT